MSLPGRTSRLGKPPPWADLSVAAIYTLFALIFTWPLPVVATHAVMGDGADAWQVTWDLWWVNRALLTGQTPYHFSTLYAPDGATNYLHLLNPVPTFMTLPVQWAFGVIPAYNVACWLALVMTAFAGYLLGRDVTGSRAAGFVTGLALGFAPHQFAQLLGHLDVASIQFFVLAVWCLYRSLSAQGRWGMVWALWSGAFVAAAMLSHYYGLFYSLIVLPSLGLYSALRVAPSLRWQAAGKTVLALLVGLAVVSPLIFAMAKQLVGPEAPERREITRGEIEYFSADLVSYFVPSTFHPLWGKLTDELMYPIKGGDAEKVVFPGYLVMALGLVGAVAPATRRKAAFWWLLSALGLVISFGPRLHIYGHNTDIPMPGELFYAIPATSILRVPARFSIVFALGLSVCAALGAQALWQRLNWASELGTPRNRLANGRLHRLALAGYPILVILELLTSPYPVGELIVEPWFRSVPEFASERSDARTDPSNYSAVLEVPFDRGDGHPLAWQTVHGLPLAGGYLSRQPVDPLSSGLPPFTDFGLNRYIGPLLFDRAKDTICRPMPDESTYLDMMRLAKVRYLVLHLDRMPSNDPRIGMAQRLFPTPPAYRSKDLIVYDTGGGTALSTLFGAVEDVEDWGGVEQGRYRWASRNFTRIYFWSGQEREAELRFKLISFAQKRDVLVSAGGELLAGATVDHRGHEFNIKWIVPKGISTVLMAISGPAIRPISIGVGSDTRPLTIQLSDCRYTSR